MFVPFRSAIVVASLAFAGPALAQDAVAPAPAAVEPAATAPVTTDAPAAPAVIAKPAAPPKPAITLSATIDLTNQRMTVSSNGQVRSTWAISSGRAGYETPTGTFRPSHLARMHYSRKYDLAPMPHSVFINGGVAVHATQATGMLGRAASHGCIRLSPGNAAEFFALVQRHGATHTQVRVTGHARQSAPAMARGPADGERRQRTAGLPYGYGYAQPTPSYGLFGSSWGQPQRVVVYRSNGSQAPAGYRVR